jgi:predicted regulator of Ras-like GTPase activity (Roadblock/LC7/MglB family)
VTVAWSPAVSAPLKHLAAVPGVVGGLVFDPSGALVASEFPPVFDVGGLQQLASQLAGDGYFQGWLSDDQASLDLRFGDGHVVVRPLEGAWLLVLCTLQTNFQLLAMSLTQVVRRLRMAGSESQGLTTGEFALPTAPAAAPAAPSAVERLRAIATAELGAYAAQALEILAAAGPERAALLGAAAEIEKLTRLFISKKKAEEIGRRLRETIGG